MDELERLLRGWRADLCTCKSVSDSQHWIGCAAGRISDDDLDILYMEVDRWSDDIMEYEVDEAVKRALSTQEPEVPYVVEDDPE